MNLQSETKRIHAEITNENIHERMNDGEVSRNFTKQTKASFAIAFAFKFFAFITK
jgi:hypothetical protein